MIRLLIIKYFVFADYVYNISLVPCNMLQKIIDFEITKEASIIVMIVILIGYVGVSFNELFVDECTVLGDCFDFDRRMSRLAVWDINWIEKDLRHFIHFGLLEISYQLFQNYKVLVLASSVLLLVVTYLFTVNMAGKRIAGILAVGIVLQSSIFYDYDTSVTYPSFWALLFVTSLYLTTTKSWYLSSISYIFTIPAKAITALYMPGVLAFLWFKNRSAFKMFSVLSVVGLILIFSFVQLSERTVGGFYLINDLHLQKFLGGFVSWMWQGFADDQVTLLLLVVGMFFIFQNRKRINNSNAIISLIFGMILTSPILTGMTTYSIWPYRMLPIVVLTALMIGMVFANLDKIDLKMFQLKPKR